MSFVSIILFALLAQNTSVAPPEEDKAKAQNLLDEGAALYEKGDYTGALEKFQAAYVAYSSPKIWFNVGQANRDLGRPVEALDAFQKFLDGASDVSPEERAQAQSSVTDLQKQLGQVSIVCEVPGASLTIDGKASGVAPLAKPIWVVPGRHQVTAIQEGAAPAVQTVEVGAGASATVVLKPSQPAVPAMPGRAGPGVEEAGKTGAESAISRGWWLGRKWTWVAAGSTVLLTAAAAGVGISANGLYDDLEKSCGTKSPDYLNHGCTESDVGPLRTRKDIANVLWALSGVAALTTAGLFFVEGHRVAMVPMAGETTGVVAWMEF